ncbi:peptidoglycan DD-metalloendopeptidase family protein [Streptomyces sp. NPDC002537]
MASNEPALDPTLHGPYEPYASYAPEPPIVPAYMTAHMPMGEALEAEAGSVPVAAAGSVAPSAPVGSDAHDAWDAWHPSAPARGGRHRVAKPRGGTMARSGAVLGVGVIAAVGAGGMASAQDRPAAPISMPDLPGVGALLGDDTKDTGDAVAPAPGADQPLTQAGLSVEEAANGTANAGEALRARILQQAEHQQSVADEDARAAVQRKAAEEAAKTAAKTAEAAKAAEAEKAAAAKTAEKEAEKEKEAEPDPNRSANKGGGAPNQAPSPEKPAEDVPRAKGSYTLPVGSYTLTAGFGQAGNMWSANHTGEDFAAPTGTPVKAVGNGTITHAGWAGAYGYRIVLKLDDGTELWFCHLSSMVVTSGRVSSGDVIGRVGATGNVTGPHLHLEVRPGGGAPIDPLPWLRDRGLEP